MPTGRVFAIIPAAGHSRRMGQPKLLLPLDRNCTVIERLLSVLDLSGITERIVVMRKDEAVLREMVQSANAIAIQPDSDPPDMRFSVEEALANIASTSGPNENDAWLLIPGDYPAIKPSTVQKLLESWAKTPAKILIPTHAGKRGHPVIFSWTLAAHVTKIPADRGLNTLVHAFTNSVVEVAVSDPGIHLDMDTPEDYEYLRRLVAEESS